MKLNSKSQYLLRRRRWILKIILGILFVIWFMIPFLSLRRNRNRNKAIPYDLQDEAKSLDMAMLSINSGNDGSLVLAAPGSQGPGEFGKPVILPRRISNVIKKAILDGYERHAFNQYVSDLISVKRRLPDPRDERCKEPGRYLKDLPQTSVVICFHNEAWSALLRTVHSVVDRSPAHLISEIILVDDFSDMAHLKQQLDSYMENLPKVIIVRTERREGLVRARLLGARYVTAPVLTYLDSHCECAEGWLEPLLDRIARNKTTVVCPVIDVINDDTFEFNSNSGASSSIGGFDWNLQFKWYQLSWKEKRKRKNVAEPLNTPVMAGGLFSINKEFFERLGTYDSGFDIWGGENLELSFKTWMCGGTLEIVPCSHVGHVFRHRSPYNTQKAGASAFKKNAMRVAKVWMDDYAKYYYARMGNEKVHYGDISSRLSLREKLGCKSFGWYLKNIYPNLFIPEDSVASGKIRNIGYWDMCLDSPTQKANFIDPIAVRGCHHQGQNQYWMYSKNGEIRRDLTCLDYSGHGVVLYPCHGAKGNQLWLYDPETKLIKHFVSGQCMAVFKERNLVYVTRCNKNDKLQKWYMEGFQIHKIDPELLNEYVTERL